MKRKHHAPGTVAKTSEYPRDTRPGLRHVGVAASALSPESQSKLARIRAKHARPARPKMKAEPVMVSWSGHYRGQKTRNLPVVKTGKQLATEAAKS